MNRSGVNHPDPRAFPLITRLRLNLPALSPTVIPANSRYANYPGCSLLSASRRERDPPETRRSQGWLTPFANQLFGPSRRYFEAGELPTRRGTLGGEGSITSGGESQSIPQRERRTKRATAGERRSTAGTKKGCGRKERDGGSRERKRESDARRTEGEGEHKRTRVGESGLVGVVLNLAQVSGSREQARPSSSGSPRRAPLARGKFDLPRDLAADVDFQDWIPCSPLPLPLPPPPRGEAGVSAGGSTPSAPSRGLAARTRRV